MTWLYTFLGFSALILLHEGGHFVAAKAVGMRVDKFSLFFGPMIVKFRRGETLYGIGTIPLGGYVKIFGMNPYELEPRPEERGGEGAPDAGEPGVVLPAEVQARAFYRQPVWKRVVVIAAGPAVNALLALVILWVVFLSSAQFPVSQSPPQVAAVVAGSPAASALRAGDVIERADGRPVTTATVVSVARAHACADGATVDGCRAATPVRLVVLRAGRDVSLTLYPHYVAAAGRPELGFEGQASRYRAAGPGKALSIAVDQIGSITSKTVSRVVQIFTSSAARKQVHSVVGASDEISQAFSYSTASAFFVLAIVSLSLAIINLFPFLPLDGGHIFWALAEKVRGRAIPFSVMERASMVGMGLVLIIFLIGFTNDVHTLSNGGFKVH